MLNNILKLIFPPKCIFCNEIINLETEFEICDKCYKKINFLPKRIQKLDNSFTFSGLICVCEYSGMVKESLKRYKFYDKSQYFRTFAKLMAKTIKEMTLGYKFDIIVSVPLHKKRLSERGYNQSELISRSLSKQLRIAEKSYVLLRTKYTKTQSLLSKEERIYNVKDAFKLVDKNKVKDKTILLVDDVMTTGQTLNECSKVLISNGAREVITAVIASGRKYK